MYNTLDKKAFDYYIKEAIVRDKHYFLSEITAYIKYPLKIEEAKTNKKYLRLWIKNAYNRFVYEVNHDISPDRDFTPKFKKKEKARLISNALELIKKSGERGLSSAEVKDNAYSDFKLDNFTYIYCILQLQRQIKMGFFEGFLYKDKRFYFERNYG